MKKNINNVVLILIGLGTFLLVSRASSDGKMIILIIGSFFTGLGVLFSLYSPEKFGIRKHFIDLLVRGLVYGGIFIYALIIFLWASGF